MNIEAGFWKCRICHCRFKIQFRVFTPLMRHGVYCIQCGGTHLIHLDDNGKEIDDDSTD